MCSFILAIRGFRRRGKHCAGQAGSGNGTDAADNDFAT
jgi:hypothetical protein